MKSTETAATQMHCSLLVVLHQHALCSDQTQLLLWQKLLLLLPKQSWKSRKTVLAVSCAFGIMEHDQLLIVVNTLIEQ
jgi:hypothetical protein